jgi:hypothetical protein
LTGFIGPQGLLLLLLPHGFGLGLGGYGFGLGGYGFGFGGYGFGLKVGWCGTCVIGPGGNTQGFMLLLLSHGFLVVITGAGGHGLKLLLLLLLWHGFKLLLAPQGLNWLFGWHGLLLFIPYCFMAFYKKYNKLW